MIARVYLSPEFIWVGVINIEFVTALDAYLAVGKENRTFKSHLRLIHTSRVYYLEIGVIS